jgi:hypothetical protein
MASLQVSGVSTHGGLPGEANALVDSGIWALAAMPLRHRTAIVEGCTVEPCTSSSSRCSTAK